MSNDEVTRHTGENKMRNLSIEATETINDLVEKDFSLKQIKFAMEDGAYLKEAGISQEISEEIHNFCRINSNLK